MKAPVAREFLDIFEAAGFTVFRGESLRRFNLNIVGWRNKTRAPNKFNDSLAVYYDDGFDWIRYVWPITTLPGRPWLLKPMNPTGAAILCPGQYRGAYEIGTFKGYRALRQVRPVSTYRDNNLDEQVDLRNVTVETGLYGLHIHRAGAFTRLVNRSSAGCQVFRYAKDFSEFMDLCEYAAKLWGNSFTYTLVEI